MPNPQVVAVAPGSPAADAGVCVGDEIITMNGEVPRDVIEYQLLADEAEVALEVRRGGLELELACVKADGEPLGIEVSSPIFDRVRTCDNHCAFCFIYQLPKGLRKSLYVKDDDYRLSFLYGNFTTLTRFTELDLERVITERLSPLYVSIHATDPEVRAGLLRNRRGATSLRWLRALLDHEIAVHGQVVVCPGVNDGAILEDTLYGVLERFPELRSLAVVPLGVSKFSRETEMRPHTQAEAEAVIDAVEAAAVDFRAVTGRRLAYASDEYYLIAGRDFPAADTYEEPSQIENGIGIARAFEQGFLGNKAHPVVRSGFFQSVDGAPAVGYRAPRAITPSTEASADAPVVILTGAYGAEVLRPLLARAGYDTVEVRAVENRFFGGNIGVAGLMSGEDIVAELATIDPQARVLLPDVCLSEGRFIDGMELTALGGRVEVIETSGRALARALRRGAPRRLLELVGAEH
jgi:putative radical SAM enzyme (TIGR03279 family)